MYRLLLIVSVVVLFVPVGHAYGYYGQISGSAGGIVGTGQWANDTGDPTWTTPTLTWTVLENPDHTWSYDYTLNVFNYDISHFLIEVSPAFTANDALSPTALQGTFGSLEVGLFTQHNGNPGMPGQTNGLKFDDADGITLQVTFDSPRMPVWGDFYAKGGKAGGTQNALWNTGFAAPDPTVPLHDGPEQNHIIVPDSAYSVPEPATLMLIATGAALLTRKRHRTSS